MYVSMELATRVVCRYLEGGEGLCLIRGRITDWRRENERDEIGEKSF